MELIFAGRQARSFRNTYADWHQIDELPPNVRDRQPDYPTDDLNNHRSWYWYTNSGVYRLSDHWGYNIGTCDWLLDGGSYDYPIRVLGYCRWDEFKDGWSVNMRNYRHANMRKRASYGTLLDVLVTLDENAYITIEGNAGSLWAGRVYSALPTAYESYRVEEFWDREVIDVVGGNYVNNDEFFTIFINSDTYRMDAPAATGLTYPEVPAYDYYFEGGHKNANMRKRAAWRRGVAMSQ